MLIFRCLPRPNGGSRLTEIDYDGKIEIISLTADKATIEMPATLTFDAEIIYKKPGAGYYDKEEGVLFFAENAEATVAETRTAASLLKLLFALSNRGPFASP
jgi:hypothetical protein